MAQRVVLLSIPQLRRRDVAPGGLAALDALAARGTRVELTPSFPGVPASSFATLVTGTGPFGHGIIGDAYFDRATGRVVPPPLPDSAMLATRIWQRIAQVRPGARTMLWFAPNAAGADVALRADLGEDGRPRTEPVGLLAPLEQSVGPYPAGSLEPCQDVPRPEPTAWILRTAAAVLARETPDLAILRVPYLGQVARRCGPDGRDACRAVPELDRLLGAFLQALPAGTLVLAATETIATPVSGPIDVNRILRNLGLLALTDAPGGGFDIDIERSAAFAVADHQLCHIYANDREQVAEIAAAFSGDHGDGVATVSAGHHHARLGLDHPRSGDVILVAEPDRWFRPDWWRTPAEAPRTRPSPSLLGAEALRLVCDPDRVRGSLGAPASGVDDRGVLVASHRLTTLRGRVQALDLFHLIVEQLAEG
jgi:hypothetical protein